MKWLIYGLGESGTAAAQALLARNEHVTVADSSGSSSSREAAKRIGVEARFGTGPEILNKGFDRIVASPGIRPRDVLLAAAEKNGPPILSEVALGLELLKDEAPDVRIAAITGTNGKTTAVDMLSRMLTASGISHAVAGNSWRALTGCLDEVNVAGTLVLEVSSFQLHYLREPGFEIAALLNARPDHLNWHDSFEEYVDDKLRVFAGQGPGDLALVSADDPAGRDAAASLAAETLVVGKDGTLVQDGKLLLKGRDLAEGGELRFVGRHNYENALFAAAAAERLGATPSGIREGLLGYRLKPHRMQVVGEHGGVTYVDDSKATNPAAVAAALASLEGPVVLIVGGSEKETDFAEVLPVLARCRAVVCQGEAGPRIARYLEESGVGVDVRLVPDLAAAVKEAGRLSRPGDVVLLSPGCASFDQFAGYAQRGEAFAELAAEVRVPARPARGAVGR